MVYKGARPEFEEYGPYIYREYDTFSNIKYDQELEIPGTSDPTFKDKIKGATKAIGLTADFNMNMKYESEMEDRMDKTAQGINTKLRVANQAAFGVWWGQLQSDKWRVAIVLLYSVVNDLGRQLAETATMQLIHDGEFKNSSSNLNIFLFKTNKLSAA